MINLETEIGRLIFVSFTFPKQFTGTGRGLALRYTGLNSDKSRKELLKLQEDYTDYKRSFVKQLQFDPSMPNLSK